MDNRSYASSVGSGNISSGNVIDSYNDTTTINNIGPINNVVNVNEVIADENPEIMQWLSPLDARGRHQDVRTSRLDGVGSWLLETNEFREWRNNEGGADEAILFCYGNPGVGKTYLSSLVIDKLCDEPGEKDIAIAMFYCDFRDQRQQTAANIIGAILKQLVIREEVLGHVQTAFQKAKTEVGGRGLLLPGMVQMLKQVIEKLPQVFICIDALDECLPKHLLELLESLRGILQVSPRMRIFVTGRPQVEAEIKRFFSSGVILVVPISPKSNDIIRYLERKLEMDTEPDAMSDSLRADIIRIVLDRISEIFLLVSLNIDTILEATTIFERRRKLMEMTKGSHVEDAYATTLSRMQAQKGSKPRLGMESLMWVSNSERPLRTSELCHALAVNIGSADLDPENIPTIRTLLACSLGLITIEPASDTVRLAHLTLQEYLSSNPGLFHSPHSMIAEVCLTYLKFQSVRELSPTLSSAPAAFALLEYASWYWGKHMRRENTKSASRLALGLLLGFEQHIASQLLLLRYYEDRWWRASIDGSCCPEGFTGIHGAAFLGIVEMVAALLETKEWDINAIDANGRTALVWAASEGHEDVVKILLQQKDVNPNVADNNYDRTPLWWAAQHGHEGVVKLLLERSDINPNIADTKYSETPLWWAASGGHEGVVRLLLERDDINPNTTDTEYGRTPLSCAAVGWHDGVVKLLLERGDVNPNIADTRYCQTPLWKAARGGNEGVVKLLLERDDINPNATDIEYGQTPLSYAAEWGREGVVKLLLERGDINPNSADTIYGRTPLLWAAKGGFSGIVQLLLERDDTNPNTADTIYSRTPLLWAARGGYARIVQLLLGRDDIDPNISDIEDCQTPLWWAAEGGHEGVVKLLLERDDINPNTADTKYGRTPLWWAAERGNEGIVQLLLERDDINPNTPDAEYCQTPLWWAAEGGHEGIVKLLLEQDDISPNTPDTKSGRTPLSLASAGGYGLVVKLLLQRDDVDLNTADTEYRQTPLSWAAEGGHEGIVKLLLERGDVDPDIPDISGQTALELASFLGHTRIVELLSQPETSLPVRSGLGIAPGRPSPEPHGPSQPIPSASFVQSGPSPPSHLSPST